MDHLKTSLLVAGLVASTGCLAQAPAFPSKPVRIIVPYATGGSTDMVMRTIAPRLAEDFGQPVVVDNRPGASSTIGLDLAAKSAPDGLTWGVPNIAFGANPSMIKKMPFDSEKDLIPVTQVAVVSMVLVVNPSLPVRSVKELLVLAKARPAQLTFGSAGNATANHLAAGLFMQRTGVDMIHVPYKGGGPAVVSLLSGETSLLFATIPAAIQHIQSGRLRALGVTRARRAAMLPDVATVAESGVPGYEAIEWNGVMVPAGTPMPVVRRIRDAIAKVLAPTEMKERLLAAGAEGVGSTPEEFSAFIRTELATWSKVVRELQLSVD